MQCPDCGEKMHLHAIRVRLQLPRSNGGESETIELQDALCTVDLMNPARSVKLVGYMCPSLRCGRYVITPEG